ncbi:hypothetical protein RJ639_008455 [Escallonia herrerae]|uniref:Uncharacterized protein n=1 Tax=Escallonia herrerae TaxID=1293975 RepID=A0AA88VVR1_9ASTE|nr:hypothetical protein RJ639_008455 [Escallonia herrerae]
MVPYHRNSIVKYQAHIHVEWCNRAKSIKYLFKYITKGPDRATMVIEKSNGTSTSRKDERDPTVQRLSFHLENEQPITFKESESLDGVTDRIDPKRTMFMQWMETKKGIVELAL